MPEQVRHYQTMLAEQDRMVVDIHKFGASITKFAVMFEVLADDRWQQVIRFDSKHSLPHRHRFSANGDEYRSYMFETDNNEALTRAIADIKQNFIRYHQAYIITISKKGNDS